MSGTPAPSRILSVAPMRGRGLKQHRARCAPRDTRRSPLRGLKQRHLLADRLWEMSLPMRGAWIETSPPRGRFWPARRRSPCGVWIEILARRPPRRRCRSLPMRRRRLKSRWRCRQAGRQHVALHARGTAGHLDKITAAIWFIPAHTGHSAGAMPGLGAGGIPFSRRMFPRAVSVPRPWRIPFRRGFLRLAGATAAANPSRAQAIPRCRFCAGVGRRSVGWETSHRPAACIPSRSRRIARWRPKRDPAGAP